MIFCWRLSQMSMSRIRKWWWRKPALKREEYLFVQMKSKVESASLLFSFLLGRSSFQIQALKQTVHQSTFMRQPWTNCKDYIWKDRFNKWLFTMTNHILILSNAIYLLRNCLTAKNCFKLQILHSIIIASWQIIERFCNGCTCDDKNNK